MNFIKKYLKISFKDDFENLNKIEIVNVLIIGGAGSIGSNYIKQILKLLKPKKLVVVDFNENGLAELTRDLRSSSLLDYNPEYISYPVNLLSDTFDKIFYSTKFDLVANFAAHKHVRSEKDKISIEALVKNNVFGAIKLLELCSLRPPNYFFSVSTDKATSPVNIMGASKLIMEKLIFSMKSRFKVTTARFANVAFSNGSLLDGFKFRLEKKQPLACPVDIKRFFVSPEQSGEICFLATFLGKSGDIFFPKLDFDHDQIYFKDIAISFLEENGYKPLIFQSEKDAKNFNFNKNSNYYPIYFFESSTTGEKKYEEFYSEDDNYFLDEYKSLGLITSKNEIISFQNIIKDFRNIFNNPDSEKIDIVNIFKKYIPEFKHVEKGKNLDDNM